MQERSVELKLLLCNCYSMLLSSSIRDHCLRCILFSFFSFEFLFSLIFPLNQRKQTFFFLLRFINCCVLMNAWSCSVCVFFSLIHFQYGFVLNDFIFFWRVESSFQLHHSSLELNTICLYFAFAEKTVKIL